MIRHLEEAFARARELPAEEQASLARFILAEIDGDAKWDAVLARLPEKLARLADQAWAEHEAGKSEQLDPEKL